MSSADVWLLAGAVALIVLSALLIAGETAVARVSRVRVEELRREGRRGADRLLTVVDDRARYVNVLLFLSSAASTTAVAFVTFVCVDSLPWAVGWSLTLAIVVMVVVRYVALGVAPRTLGRQHAERIALRAAGPARAFAALLGPITTLLILLGNALTPGKGYRQGPFDTQAELRELVDLAEADRLIEDDEAQMIHSVFELGDTVAREVMVPRTEMVSIERTKTLRQAMSLGLRSGFSRIPVTGDNTDDVVGIVYLKDVTRRTFEHRDAEQSERVESLMRQAYFVPDSKRVDDLLREMQAARVHMAVLVDEYGGTAGIVTIEDILEEIVGEIADEYDTESPEVQQLADGGWLVSARMHLDDLAELLDVDLDAEEEDVDTAAGLLAKRLGRVPIPGASVEVEGYRLVAEEAAGRRNRIGRLRVTPLASAPPPSSDRPPTAREPLERTDA
ncbi:MAG: hemolysin family protein [Candidatus Nanopelagicales bacterium]